MRKLYAGIILVLAVSACSNAIGVSNATTSELDAALERITVLEAKVAAHEEAIKKLGEATGTDVGDLTGGVTDTTGNGNNTPSTPDPVDETPDTTAAAKKYLYDADGVQKFEVISYDYYSTTVKTSAGIAVYTLYSMIQLANHTHHAPLPTYQYCYTSTNCSGTAYIQAYPNVVMVDAFDKTKGYVIGFADLVVGQIQVQSVKNPIYAAWPATYPNSCYTIPAGSLASYQYDLYAALPALIDITPYLVKAPAYVAE